jgi:glutathione S-transferase
VRIVLEEKGIPYESVVINLSKMEQKTPPFLTMNPYGQVPVISDDDVVIYDSTIINEYLEEKYPNPPLMPRDPRGKARVRMMEDYRDEHFHPNMYMILHELRHKQPSVRDEDAIRTGREKTQAEFPRLERELAGREFLAGSFSIADIAFVPNILLFQAFGIEVPSNCKNVLSWMVSLKNRASTRKLMKEDGLIS